LSNPTKSTGFSVTNFPSASVYIIRHTAPKGRKALAGSELYRGVDKINEVGTVLLEIEDELGREAVGKRLEDDSCFLVYLLDRSFDYMAVGIRSCMSDVSTEET